MHEYGSPDVLRIEEVPLPSPGEGEVRLQLEAIGVNFIDIYQRIGRYQGSLPFAMGQEAAGTVDLLGAGVEGLRPGDRVAFASVQGAYAEYALVPAWRLVRVPDGMQVQTAAAAMIQGMTAHYLAHSTFPLKAGDTALVHAAAGGTGQLLVQCAKLRGARVIATVSTDEKAQLARQAGADEVIVYTRDDFEAGVKRLTAGQGVDVVYDSVGKETFERSLNCLRRRGTLVLFGQSSGSVPPIDPQTLNAKGSLYLTRPNLVHYTADRAELTERASAVFKMITTGELVVHIGRTFPLAAAADAHRYLEGRQSTGKVLLLP